MLREHCKVGMIVEFGRGGGQWTKGQVVKLNPKMAKVKTLESRGFGNGSQVGSLWSVAYDLMRPECSGTTAPTFNDPADDPVHYSKFGSYADNCIMDAIVETYSNLSPECLTADGERPISQVRALKSKFESRLNHLFKALGRPVSETVAYQWAEEKRKQTV